MLYLLPFLVITLPTLQASPWFDNYKEAHNVYKHYNEEKPLLIVFSAEWCGPCKMLKKEFDKIKQEQLHDRYVCVRVDIDDPANKYLITHAQKSFPELWPRGVMVPATVVIGADRMGAKLGYMNVKEIIAYLKEVEDEWKVRITPKKEKKVEVEAVPDEVYYVPRYSPTTGGCPTCY